MPSLPTVISKESVRVGGVNTEASPNAFGYQVGRAVQGVGEEITATGRAVVNLQNALEGRKEKDAKVRVSNAIAQTDLGKIYQEQQQAAPADGTGIADNTFRLQKDEIDRLADEHFKDDPEARDKYRSTMYERLPGWRDRAREVEFNQRDAYNTSNANRSLDTLINRVRTDPGQYDLSLTDAAAVIQAGDYPEAAKTVMIQNLRSNLAAARFESLTANADSDDDFIRLQSELESERWQKEMSKEQYDKTVSAVRTSRNAFITGMDAQARSVLTGMAERSKNREVIPDTELREMSDMMNVVKSPAITTGFIKLLSEQQLLRQFKDAPPSQLDQAAKHIRDSNPVITGTVGKWASDASVATGGEVSASFMVSLVGLEYSASDIKAGRFNVKNPNSTAGGITQFVDGTWVSMMQKYGGRFGYEPGKMTRSQMLALRADPGLSMKMGALYALENKRIMQQAGINPNDTDLYLAHFLGPQGAIDFLRARRSDPTGTVRAYGAFGNAAINANPGVFRAKGARGQLKSFEAVYSDMAARMQPGVGQTAFDHIQYIEGMRDSKQEVINRDPMTQYADDGKMGIYALDSANSFATRGADALGAAQYYNISAEEMKPFTEQEAATLKKQLQEGTADEKLQLMALISNMDRSAPGMARSAYTQLGEKDSVLGYAASLMYDKNEAAVASQIIRGQQRIKDDKTGGKIFGESNEDSAAFYTYVGGGLSDIRAETRNAIFEAAKAHYAEVYSARGNLTFDANQFKASIRAVLGAGQGEPVDEVNSVPTIMPPGIDAQTFETALDGMTDGDMAAMSRDQVPPKDIHAEPVSVRDIADEGQFVWIGRNQYRIRMSDGNYLTTGEADPAAPFRLKAFVFVAQPNMLKKFAGRVTPEMSPDTPANLSMQGGGGLGGISPTLPGEYAQ